MLRTVTQEFKELDAYGKNLNILSNNFYNKTNYVIRQLMTGLSKDNPTPNEEEVINLVREYEVKYNIYKKNPKLKKDGKPKNIVNNSKKKSKTKKSSKKEYKELRFDSEHWMPTYDFLNYLFKETNDVDYRALPVHTAQKVIRQVIESWTGYFNANKEYKVCPDKFTGKPKIPKYHKKGGYNVAVISNDPVKIKDGILSLPACDIKIDVSKMLENIKSDYDLTLLNIKIKIEYGKVFLKLTFEERISGKAVKSNIKKDNKRYAAIDLGINNLATIVNNIGNSPILIKGGYIKAYNRNVNKKVANLQSTLKTINDSYNSKRINRLWEKRDIFFKNEFGRISNQIIKYLIDNNINTLIIGKNDNWKQNVNLGKTNNQNFAYIPFEKLIFQLEYKCAANGIKFIEVEESYTSKASFLDNDKIPVYDKNDKTECKFSGTRIKRGLYKTKKGILINADVNGACNILKKYKKSAFKNIDTKYLLNVKRM